MSLAGFRKLAWAGAAVAFCVIVLGAWVRLSDAGLGCPDWPGCYGELTWPGHAAEIEEANAAWPSQPYEAGKAWREMVHRYAAAALGLLIFVLAGIAWRRRNEPGQPVKTPLLLMALVLFQALLGMWTVTLKLHPVIVMAHLMGGLATLGLLVWTALDARPRAPDETGRLPHRLALLALAVLLIQIMLGGWTSANYAALACPDFPTCQGAWWPDADFAAAFDFIHPVGVNYEYGALDLAARTAIHLAHRMWAIVTALALTAAAFGAWRTGLRRLSVALIFLVVLQVGLGIANVVLRLPLPVAAAHNATAALLLVTLVTILYRTKRKPLWSSTP